MNCHRSRANPHQAHVVLAVRVIGFIEAIKGRDCRNDRDLLGSSQERGRSKQGVATRQDRAAMPEADYPEVKLLQPFEAALRLRHVFARGRQLWAAHVDASIGGEKHPAVPPPVEGDLARAVSGHVDRLQVWQERGEAAALKQAVDMDRLDGLDAPHHEAREKSIDQSRGGMDGAEAGTGLQDGRVDRMRPDHRACLAFQGCHIANVVGMSVSDQNVTHVCRSPADRPHAVEDLGNAAWEARVEHGQTIVRSQNIDVHQAPDNEQIVRYTFD